MCHGPCPVVSQLCVTYAASVSPSVNLFFCPLSPRWFCRDSTTAASHSTASQGVPSDHTRSSATCTGCAFLDASSSVWPLLRSSAVTRPHLNTSRETYSELMTISLADDYDRRKLTSWLSVAHDSEQLVIVRSVLPHLECGTVCLPTSSPHRRLPPSYISTPTAVAARGVRSLPPFVCVCFSTR